MNQFITIHTELEHSVLTVFLNRPDKHNALNIQMISELTDVFRLASGDDSIRMIVLRGHGKSFCAGADLHYMQEIARFGEEENRIDALRLASLFQTVNECQKPVIALLHGAVYGGANGLAAACDVVLAEETTVFSFSEVKIGISPATISPYVLARCGETAARDLMLTGRRFDAHEAEKFSLVTKVVSSANASETLEFYCNQFLSAAPEAVAETKRLIRTIFSKRLDIEQIKFYTAGIIASQRAGHEGQEGINAFFEKRKPDWFTEL
jgi:methylglutaconyl-CoA hydratase